MDKCEACGRPVWPDFNHNGVPDYEEPAILRGAWWLALTLVRAFAPPNTIVRKGVEQIEAARQDAP